MLLRRGECGVGEASGGRAVVQIQYGLCSVQCNMGWKPAQVAEGQGGRAEGRGVGLLERRVGYRKLCEVLGVRS